MTEVTCVGLGLMGSPLAPALRLAGHRVYKTLGASETPT
jgi:3-hydroxyisobutyrate dehydrogenase-like beta-hydroxyacid dehydrogenase